MSAASTSGQHLFLVPPVHILVPRHSQDRWWKSCASINALNNGSPIQSSLVPYSVLCYLSSKICNIIISLYIILNEIDLSLIKPLHIMGFCALLSGLWSTNHADLGKAFAFT